MKNSLFLYYFILVCFTLPHCTSSKVVGAKYYDNYTKKNAQRVLGEFANGYARTNGILGLRYETYGTEHRGGASFIDLKIKGDDSRDEIFLNELRFTRNKHGLLPDKKYFQFCPEECTMANARCYCDDDKTISLYGQDVLLRYSYGNQKRIEAELYVPELIKVSFPSAISDNWNHVSVPRDDFEIRWNADSKNSYGVVISVACTYGEDNEYRMKRTVKVDDNGSFTVDRKILKEIPSGSRLLLNVSRGRYPIVKDNEGDDYKLIFSSEFNATITLI